MLCELCGKETKTLQKVIVEGSTMDVCESCTGFGKIIPPAPSPPVAGAPVLSPRRVYREKDIYEKMDKTLIPNWADVIKTARKQKGMTRQDLGAAIGERTITVAHLENEELNPTDEMAKKLERELNVTLFEEIKSTVPKSKENREGLTIGDILEYDDDAPRS